MSRPQNRAPPSKCPRDLYSSRADKKRGRHRTGSMPRTEGPPPPRNTTRRRNAAEHFWDDHQGAYEARARSSGCRMRSVREHCETCPQLRDQIRKRRSDAQPTREARLYSAAELCAHCRRLLGHRALPRAPPRPWGVRKAKAARNKATHIRQHPKIRRNVLTVYRRPYFSSDSTVYSLESVKNNVDGEKQKADPVQSGDVDSEGSRTAELKKPPAPSVASAGSRASRNSMSSYHSFGSMGQPPIV